MRDGTGTEWNRVGRTGKEWTGLEWILIKI